MALFQHCSVLFELKGLPFKEKEKIKLAVTDNGGRITFVANKECSLIVTSHVSSLSPSRLRNIVKHQIPVVGVNYVHRCVEADCRLPVEDFKLNVFSEKDLSAECKVKWAEPTVTAKPSKGQAKPLEAVTATQSAESQKGRGGVIENYRVYKENDRGLPKFPKSFQVAKYAIFQKSNGRSWCLLELQSAKSDSERKYCVVRYWMDDIQSKKSAVRDQMVFVSKSEEAVKVFQALTDSVKAEGLKQQNHGPPQVTEMGSAPLQQLLLEEKLHTGALSLEVGQFVELLWKEALGCIDLILDTPVHKISLNDVTRAEGFLLQAQKKLLENVNDALILENKSEAAALLAEYNTLLPQRSVFVPDLSSMSKQFDLCQLIRDILNVSEMTLGSKVPSSVGKYRALRCSIEAVPKGSSEFETVTSLLQHRKVQVQQILRVNRSPELQSFKSELGSIKSLLHSSRPHHFVGILSRGLLMPGVAVSQHGIQRTDAGNLGSGIYFSNDINSTLKYSQCSQTDGSRLVLVCDVALGRCKDLHKTNPTLTQAPEGYSSVHGVQNTPGVQSEFMDNEYVVYSPDQVKLKYVVRLSLEGDELKDFAPEIVQSEEPLEVLSPPDHGVGDVEDGIGDITNPLDSVTAGLLNSSGQQIPLQAVNVKCKLVDLLAQVIIFQKYTNDSSMPIEAKYVFPLDDSAAVCGFEAFINGKHVVGQVKEKETARREYRQAIEKGHGAYLMDQDAPDVFTISVGNLPPGATVLIKVTFVSELIVKDGSIFFSLPSSVAPWQESAALNQTTQVTVEKVCVTDEEANTREFNLDMSIEMPHEITEVKCITHKVKMKKTDCKAVVSVLDGEEMGPEGFQLLVTLTEVHVPRMWVEQHPNKDSQACMLVFYPKFEVASPDTSDEVVLLLDASQSMRGEPLNSARMIALQILKTLDPSIPVNVIFFGTDHSDAFLSTRPIGEARQEAKNFIKHFSSAGGSTELWRPLRALSLLPPSSGMRNLLLLSDGHIQNTELTLQLLRDHAPHTRLFTCGLSPTANRHMLRALAQTGGGAYEFFDSKSKHTWSEKVASQLKRMQAPGASSVSVKWQQFNPTAPPPVQAPKQLHALFNDCHTLVFGFVPHCTQATLLGNLSGQEIGTMVSTSELQKTKGTFLHKLTARAIIRDFEDGSLDSNAVLHEEKKAELKSFVIELSKEFSILSQFTSFVAIEERDSEEEKGFTDIPKLIAEEDVDFLPYMGWVSTEDSEKEEDEEEEEENSDCDWDFYEEKLHSFDQVHPILHCPDEPLDLSELLEFESIGIDEMLYEPCSASVSDAISASPPSPMEVELSSKSEREPVNIDVRPASTPDTDGILESAGFKKVRKSKYRCPARRSAPAPDLQSAPVMPVMYQAPPPLPSPPGGFCYKSRSAVKIRNIEEMCLEMPFPPPAPYPNIMEASISEPPRAKLRRGRFAQSDSFMKSPPAPVQMVSALSRFVTASAPNPFLREKCSKKKKSSPPAMDAPPSDLLGETMSYAALPEAQEQRVYALCPPSAPVPLSHKSSRPFAQKPPRPPPPAMNAPPSDLIGEENLSFPMLSQHTAVDIRSPSICDLIGSAWKVKEESERAIPHSVHRLQSEEQQKCSSPTVKFGFGRRAGIDRKERHRSRDRERERERITEDYAGCQEVQLESDKSTSREVHSSVIQTPEVKRTRFSNVIFGDNISKWHRIFTLQHPDGYWELCPALGTLLNCDISRFADDFLKRKGIASLAFSSDPIHYPKLAKWTKAHSDILKLLATLLVLQLMRLEKLLEGQLLRTLFCLEDTSFRPDHWEAVNRAVKWARWADRQYPCVYSRLEFGLSWDSSTKQLLGAEKIHQRSPLTGLNLNLRPTMETSSDEPMGFLMEPEKFTMKRGKEQKYESDEETYDDIGFGLFSSPTLYETVSIAISAPLSPMEIEINEISSESVLEPVHSSGRPAPIPATDGRHEDLLDLHTTGSRSEARKSDWSPFVLYTPDHHVGYMAKMSAETFSSSSPFAQTPPPPPLFECSWGAQPTSDLVPSLGFSFGQTRTQHTAVNQSMLTGKSSRPFAQPPPPPPSLGAPMGATLQSSSGFGFGQTPTQHTGVDVHSAPIQPHTLFGSAQTVVEEDKDSIRHSRSARRRLLEEQQKSPSRAVSFGFGGSRGRMAPLPPPSMAAPPSNLQSSSGFSFVQTPTQPTAVHMHSAPIQPHTYAAAPCGLFRSAETVMEEDKDVIREGALRRPFAKRQTFPSHAVRFGFGGQGGMVPPPQPQMAAPPSTLQSSLGFSFGQTPTQHTPADMRSAHIPCDLSGSAETVMERGKHAILHSVLRPQSEEHPKSPSHGLIDFGGRGRMALEHRDGEREKIPEDLAVSREVQLESDELGFHLRRSRVQRYMPKRRGFSQGVFGNNMSKWPRIFTLQHPDGYWEPSPPLCTLLNCDISRFADDFLKRKGIASLGMKAHSDILKLLATLLVLQLMRLEKLMVGQLLRTLFCLEDTNFRPDHWEAVNRAVKWARWADRQYPCVYSRLEFGLSWESSTKQLLGAEMIHQCSPLTGLNLNPRPTMVQS